MLNRKFETLFSERCKMEEKEQKRLRKVQKREQRKKQTAKSVGYSQKMVMDAIEDKSNIAKITRGPFYQLESKKGLYEDPVASDFDVIDAANQPCLSILILGKPRAGKSTTAQSLSSALDIVHINMERFISAVLKKVEEHEPPEDLEEG